MVVKTVFDGEVLKILAPNCAKSGAVDIGKFHFQQDLSVGRSGNLQKTHHVVFAGHHTLRNSEDVIGCRLRTHQSRQGYHSAARLHAYRLIGKNLVDFRRQFRDVDVDVCIKSLILSGFIPR